MAEKTLTHKDLAKALKVSETTIKSYRRKFADCIPVASKGKPIRFTQEALAVSLRIRDLFETGMSVKEVRARLAQEFSWIALVAAKPEPASPTVALPQEFTLSLSNLAKSMVTLTQQQGAVINRILALETRLETLPVRASSQSDAAAPHREEKDLGPVLDDLRDLLQRELAPLSCLDEVRDLAASLRVAADKMAQAAQVLREVALRPAEFLQQSVRQETAEPSRVIPFPVPGNTGESVAPAAPAAPEPLPADPPRAFLLMPLVVRTAGGAYISAGGKSGGRFTLNDLKALLAYGKLPPEHYTLQWEKVPGTQMEWRLLLEQPQSHNPRAWQLVVKESVSQRGISVAEVVQLADAGQNVHPAEFCAFVAGLSEV